MSHHDEDISGHAPHGNTSPDPGGIKANALYSLWAARYRGYWSQVGLGPSASDYAYVVCEQRTGARASLSWGYSLVQGPVSDRENRAKVRSQVDGLLA